MCSLVEAKFIEKGIAPDAVAKAPLEPVKIVFAGNLQVNLGKELAPVQVKDQPQVSWDVEEGAFYTLVFSDLDARLSPNGPTYTFLHWIVGNIPGNDLAKGQVLCQYVGSAPTKGTGLHSRGSQMTTIAILVRHDLTNNLIPTTMLYMQVAHGIPYVYLVYKHADKIEFDEKFTDVEHRRHFSTQDFATKHGFGRAQFGNFYVAQSDAYAEEFHRKLAAARAAESLTK